MKLRDSTAAGWRVLARHLRYARNDPRRVGSIAWRAVQVVMSGELGGVLRRHTVTRELTPHYREWLAGRGPLMVARRALLQSQLASAPPCLFHVVVPLRAASRPGLERTLQSLRAQSYPHWRASVACAGELTSQGGEWIAACVAVDSRIDLVTGEAGDSPPALVARALDRVESGFAVLLEPHDALDGDALLEFAARKLEDPSLAMMYADEDEVDEDFVNAAPNFKPAFDREWLITTDFVGDPLVLRTPLLREVLAKVDGSSLAWRLDLLLRIDEVLPADAVAHIPRVLYHRDAAMRAERSSAGFATAMAAARRDVAVVAQGRRGSHARVDVEGDGVRVEWRIADPPPTVTLVVPLRDRPDLLAQCTKGLREVNDYDRWRAVLVDNGSVDPDTLALLRQLSQDPRFTVVRDARPFNYAALCNAGVDETDSDVIVLLNNDVVPLGAGWLRELVSHAMRPEIGMVGATLYYPDMTIQHAGVILWLNGVADRPYIGAPRGYAGVDGRLASTRTVTGMITACAALRRSLFLDVGGMDESLPVGCNDIDLCLRVAARGLRNIVTPFAELLHYESASRGYRYRSQASLQVLADEARFRERWQHQFPADPTYNPNLTLAGTAYTLADPKAGA